MKIVAYPNTHTNKRPHDTPHLIILTLLGECSVALCFLKVYKKTTAFLGSQAFNDYYTTEHNRLLTLWRDVVSVKRLFAEMQSATDRDLNKIKNEMDSTCRELQSVSCTASATATATSSSVMNFINLPW